MKWRIAGEGPLRTTRRDISEEVVFEQRPISGRGANLRLTEGTNMRSPGWYERNPAPAKDYRKGQCAQKYGIEEEKSYQGCLVSSWNWKHLNKPIVSSVLSNFSWATYCTSPNTMLFCHSSGFNAAARKTSILTSHLAQELTVRTTFPSCGPQLVISAIEKPSSFFPTSQYNPPSTFAVSWVKAFLQCLFKLPYNYSFSPWHCIYSSWYLSSFHNFHLFLQGLVSQVIGCFFDQFLLICTILPWSLSPSAYSVCDTIFVFLPWATWRGTTFKVPPVFQVKIFMTIFSLPRKDLAPILALPCR